MKNLKDKPKKHTTDEMVYTIKYLALGSPDILKTMIEDIASDLFSYKEDLNRYENFLGGFNTDNIYSLLMKFFLEEHIKPLLPVFDFNERNNFGQNVFEMSLQNRIHITTSDIFMEYILNNDLSYKEWNIVNKGVGRGGSQIDVPLIESILIGNGHPCLNKVLLVSEHPFTYDMLGICIEMMVCNKTNNHQFKQGWVNYVDSVKGLCEGFGVNEYKNDLLKIISLSEIDFSNDNAYNKSAKGSLKEGVLQKMYAHMEKVTIDCAKDISNKNKTKSKL